MRMLRLPECGKHFLSPKRATLSSRIHNIIWAYFYPSDKNGPSIYQSGPVVVLSISYDTPASIKMTILVNQERHQCTRINSRSVMPPKMLMSSSLAQSTDKDGVEEEDNNNRPPDKVENQLRLLGRKKGGQYWHRRPFSKRKRGPMTRVDTRVLCSTQMWKKK